MNLVKKLLTAVIALVMMLGMSITASAQEITLNPADEDGATITINNPAKGESYSLYKLFDATVSADGNIAYQGIVPASLTDFFVADENGNISPTDAIAVKENDKIVGTQMTEELKAALEAWANDPANTALISEVSNGEPSLEFKGLPYGYYVMVTSHTSDPVGDAEAKAAISVTSTIPNAVINDKNVNEPSASKEADKDKSYSVGDTVTYTLTFDAPNYMVKEGGEDGESEQVVSYTIKDTLPDFLSNVTITSVTVQQPAVENDIVLVGYTEFDEDTKSITIPWVVEYPDDYPTENHEYTSLYKAGSQIVITYTAVLTSDANVGAANTNKVSIMPNVDRGGNEPEPYKEEDEWNDTETITTHAAALQKTDGEEALAGAKFAFKGLTLTGENGIYTVVSYDPDSDADFGTEVEVGPDGKLIIAGIDENITLVGKETKAPEGYNLLVGTFDLPTITMNRTTTTTWGTKTTYYDAEGNIVDEEVEGGSSTTEKVYATISDIPVESILEIENEKGTELPSTGGMGTTIFYTLGGMLVLCAGILLVSRRRMSE